MANEIEFKVNVTGLADLKKQLREARDEVLALQSADVIDQKKIAEATARAGALKDALNDANEQIAVMSSGSEFEKVSKGLGLIGNQLSDLDFSGAAESAKKLTSTIKDLNPSTVIAGFKGLISVVGSLGTAFVQLGLKLLANPLFFIAAVIIGVVIAIVQLKDKLKIAQIAFDALTAPIKLVIQLLKDMSDAFGLTAFAAEEAADKAVAANKRQADSIQKVSDTMEAEFDRQIKLQKAQGKDTEKLEAERIKLQITTANRLMKIAADTVVEYKKILATNKVILNDAQKKELADARTQVGKQHEIALNGENDLKVLRAENRTEDIENAKKASEARIKIQRETNQILLDIELLRINLLEDGIDKELELITHSYNVKISKAKENELLFNQTTQTFTKLGLQLTEGYLLERNNLYDIASGKEIARRAKFNKEIEDAEFELRSKLFDLGYEENLKIYRLNRDFDGQVKVRKLIAYKEEQITAKKLNDENRAIIKKQNEENNRQLEQDIASLDKEFANKKTDADKKEYAKRLKDLQDFYAGKAAIILAENQAQVITDEELNKRIAIRNQEIDDAENTRRLNVIADYLDRAGALVGQFGALLNVLSTNRLNDLQATSEAELSILEEQKQKELDAVGNNALARENIEKKFAKQRYELQLKQYKEEEKIKKQAFEQDKATKLVQIVISTAAGIMRDWEQGALLGGPLSILTAAMGALQFATVAATKYNAGTPPKLESTGGSSSLASLNGNADANKNLTPNQTVLVGKQFELNEVTGGLVPSESAKSAFTVKAIVVESDVTGTQNQIRHIENLAQLGG